MRSQNHLKIEPGRFPERRSPSGRLRVMFLLLVLCGIFVARAVPAAQHSAIADFTDIAEQAGLTMTNVFGGKLSTKYILESTGTGVAIFDYDNDGWPDIFLVNGIRLAGLPREAPTNHLYRNNHDGTFTDVTSKAGLQATGWGQGVCVGDYDNDGWEDLYVTYYGTNRLYHSRGDSTFEEVAQRAGVKGEGHTWGSGCAFMVSVRHGRLDIMVANDTDFVMAA